jgi:hypothetical protein
MFSPSQKSGMPKRLKNKRSMKHNMVDHVANKTASIVVAAKAS